MNIEKYEFGTKKMDSINFEILIYNKKKLWDKSNIKISKNQIKIINKYMKNKNLKYIIDSKNKTFLKGYLNPENIILGERIKYLPNGKKISKGGFSIFAKKLKLNDNLKSKNNWDIQYENSSGTKTYLYDETKIILEQNKKYEIVKKFSKKYDLIMKKLKEDINSKTNIENENEVKNNKMEYILLYLLIKTNIRVGNIEYYNLDKHKGLSTLQKKDIKINLKERKIIFDFIGKDAIPQHIEKKIDENIILILKKIYDRKKPTEFFFTNNKNQIIHSYKLSKILFNYTKIHFYPHIIRSYYANKECINFLKNHKKATKKQVDLKIYNIAKNLGHNKFNKRKKIYQINPKITIENYIHPKIYEKMHLLYSIN